ITSTTPLQALYLMNDPFVHEQARRFAARLISEEADETKRIERAHLLAFGRPCTEEEREASMNYLTQVRARLKSPAVKEGHEAAAAWGSYVRAMLMTNEFVYVN